MPRSDDRKDALLGKLADFVLAHGLDAASLRPLARAAGTSDRMLIYHFTDKDTLISATLERIAGRLVAQLTAQASPDPIPAKLLESRLLDMVMDEEIWPYLRLWLQIAARAALGDAFFKAVGGQIGRGFVDWIAAQIEAPDEAQRNREAARMLVMIEGLVLVKSLGLDDICRPALKP